MVMSNKDGNVMSIPDDLKKELEEIKKLELELEEMSNHCPRCNTILVDSGSRCPSCGWTDTIPEDKKNKDLENISKEVEDSEKELEKSFGENIKLPPLKKRIGKILVHPKVNVIEYRCEKCGSIVNSKDKECSVCHTRFV